MVRPDGLLAELLDYSCLRVLIAVEDFTPKEWPKETSPPARVARQSKAPAPSKEEHALDSDRLGQARTLEALRFGLVPSEGLPELTLGYEEWKRWLHEILPMERQNKPTVAEIVGPFGSGKSHFMSVVRHVAQEAGFLTCSVEVDGRRVSLCDPSALLFALWSSLSGKELTSATPLLDLYVKAVEAGRPAPCIARTGIDRVRDNYQAIKLLARHKRLDQFREQLDCVLSSESTYTPSQVNQEIRRDPELRPLSIQVRGMIGRNLDERPHDFVECLVGNATVATLAGYRGLVITIDEFEVEWNLAPDKWTRVRQLLEALGDYLGGRLEYHPTSLAVFFASVPQRDAVGDNVLDRLVERSQGHRKKLDVWTSASCRMLVNNIHDLYRSYHGIHDACGSEQLFCSEDDGTDASGHIRTFIKTLMARLDARYGPPANDR